jgi:hypothetical protein
MRIIVEQATNKADRAAIVRIRQQVFEREMGLTLEPLSPSDKVSHLLARIEPNSYPIGAVSVIDTSGDQDLHNRFRLDFDAGARIARFSHLAVLMPYRGMNIPLMMMHESFRQIIGPGEFHHTWLLFDAQRAASSSLVKMLGFKVGKYSFSSAYGQRCALVRDERATRTALINRQAEQYLKQTHHLSQSVEPASAPSDRHVASMLQPKSALGCYSC